MSKSRVQMILAALLAVLVLAGGWWNAQPGHAQTPGPVESVNGEPLRTVTVSGTGQVRIQPDYALVRVGVQTEAGMANAALTANNEQMQSLLEALRQAGIAAEDIQTQTVQLQPRYDQPGPQGGSPELSGYTARNVVQVRVDNLDNLGRILDQAIQAGGNTIEGIQFEISNPGELLDQARQEAFNEAQRQAEQLAGLAGAELGQTLTIQESGGGPPRPLAETTFAARADVPIEPGTQTVEVTILGTWRLR